MEVDLWEGTGHIARLVLEASEGVRLLTYDATDYDLLLLPSLSNLKHPQLFCPALMKPTQSSPVPPFRLSHLEISLYYPITDALLEKIVGGSNETLTTLDLYLAGDSLVGDAAMLAVFSHTSFPHLRHLSIKGTGPHFSAFIPLLALIPSLQSMDFQGRMSGIGYAVAARQGTTTHRLSFAFEGNAKIAHPSRIFPTRMQ